MESQELIPLGVMARRLRVPVVWLRDEALSGRVPCLQAGRAYLFDPEAVIRVLAERAAEWPSKSEASPCPK